MSLLPFLYIDYPAFRLSQMIDKHFGMALDPEDLQQPLTVPRLMGRSPAGYVRNTKSLASQKDSGSTVSYDQNNKFQVNLDVNQFKPEEISVKVTDENTLTIECEHEEKEDEHGYIYRHFVRKYTIPTICDVKKIESKVSSDGVLTITAPRINAAEVEYKDIPIIQTGEAAEAMERE